MAKIISSKDIDNSAIFYTLNIPQKGEKVLFIPSEFCDGVAVAFQKEDGGTAYANGFKCLLAGADGLRPFVFPWNSVIANGTQAIEGSTMPQMLHAVTSKIARGGFRVLDELASKKAVGEVGALYALTIKKRAKDETYTWTTVGVNETDQTYKATKEKITFGNHEITKEEIISFFADYMERQNKRLAIVQA